MTVPGNLSSPLLATAAEAAAAAAGPIKSLRFNSDDSAYLSSTSGFANSDTKTMTFSFWIKRVKSTTVKATQYIYSLGGNGTAFIDNDQPDKVGFNLRGTTGTNFFTYTEAILRDFSAWYHIVVALDLDNSTTSERFKCYINGVQQTMSNTSFPNNNYHDGETWYIGSYQGVSHYTDFYLADFYHIAGLALDPTSFGAYDSNNVWQAAEYSGTFGTNGFHLLDFANESTVGHDSSGNNNDFTANNISGSENPVYSRTAASSITNPANIFDGSTSTGGYSSSTGTNITLTTSSFTISTQLRVYNNFRSDGTYAICLNGTCVAVAGSGTDSTQYRYSTVDLSSFTLPLTVTSLGYSASQTSGNTLRAIEVDSTVLVDGTPSNLDVLFDVPTNGTQSDTGAGGEVSGNYAVLNPLDNGGATLANGNLNVTEGSSASMNVRATIGLTSGKYYWELTNNSPDYYATGSGNTNSRAGISSQDGPINAVLGSNAEHYVFEYAGVSGGGSGGRLQNNNSSSDFGSVIAQNDVLNIACDFTAGKIWYGKNGTFFNSGDPANGTNASQTFTPGGKAWFPAVAQRGVGGTNAELNFGQRAFSSSAPSGYKALCTTNLPTPTIADGSDYFDAKLHTGNGSTQTISGFEFSPDFVWVKQRNTSRDHRLANIISGTGKDLRSNANNAEITDANGITAFNSDGFSVGTSTGWNQSSGTYVSWCWDAGSSTVSNTDGSITSSVRASQTSGFSVVSYSGSGSAPSTVGHGLGAAPSLIFFKRRDTTSNWITYNSSIGATKYLALNNTGAAVTDSGPFNDTAATSTVFTVNTFSDLNASGGTYVAFCFAPVAGYSAMSVYSGNSSTDGPMVVTGFRPRFVLIKATNATANWVIHDSARDTFNEMDAGLYPHSGSAEETSPWGIDFLSNGFKLRTTNGGVNQTGLTYLYYAVAENPFQANGGLAR